MQCHDCGHDTEVMGELYMVHHWIWEWSTGGEHANMLCIGCLEKRFGRILSSRDFIDCPLNNNEDNYWTQSLRLRSRLRSHDAFNIHRDVRHDPVNPRAPQRFDDERYA